MWQILLMILINNRIGQRKMFGWPPTIFVECVPLLVSSASINCLKAVMSRNVNKSNTTKSRSLRIGATWSRSHNGVSGLEKKTKKRKKQHLCEWLTVFIFSEIHWNKRFPFWLKRSNAKESNFKTLLYNIGTSSTW